MFKIIIKTIAAASTKSLNAVKKGASDFKEGFIEGFTENYSPRSSIDTSKTPSKQ